MTIYKDEKLKDCVKVIELAKTVIKENGGHDIKFISAAYGIDHEQGSKEKQE